MSLLHVTSSGKDLTPTQRAYYRRLLRSYGVSPAKLALHIAGTLTPDSIREGSRWYVDAHKFAGQLATTYGVSTVKAAAVVAAISPRMSWERNKEIAERALTHHDPSLSVDEAADRIGGALRQLALIPSIKILRGAPISDALTGVKRRSFFNNILNPLDPNSVTIDTWMLRALIACSPNIWSLTDAERALKASEKRFGGAGAGYIALADATRDVAATFGVSPSIIQASYWVAQRGSSH